MTEKYFINQIQSRIIDTKRNQNEPFKTQEMKAFN